MENNSFLKSLDASEREYLGGYLACILARNAQRLDPGPLLRIGRAIREEILHFTTLPNEERPLAHLNRAYLQLLELQEAVDCMYSIISGPESPRRIPLASHVFEFLMTYGSGDDLQPIAKNCKISSKDKGYLIL